MARIPALNALSTSLAHAQWHFCESDADAYASPADIPTNTDWLPAIVPGTVAQSLRALGQFDPSNPRPLEDRDFWYRATIEGQGPEILAFEGLATIAEVFLDGEKVLDSSSMFVESTIDVDLTGHHELSICFRALGPLLAQPGKRARWRPRMVAPATLRAFRTTFLGHMPGWCPPVHAIGPWRAITRRSAADPIRKLDLRSSYVGSTGTLDLRIESMTSTPIEIECAGARLQLEQINPTTQAGRLNIENVEPWWPHTHGKPVLHDVVAIIDGQRRTLSRTGFRRIEVDRDSDGKGFGLRVNGEAVFCRGAVWTTPDVVSLPSSREAYEPWLKLARDAKMNMLRIGGTMVYEADAFYQICDELGILVWQDFILANFDYPAADETFVASIDREARQFLDRTQASPCIAVLCGGSEIAQQSAMLGLPRNMWSNRIFDDVLPRAVESIRPDAIYLPNTPHGGQLPFEPAEGVCHYYGVSAYMRPLDDARYAGVRFAAESLGHAHVPDMARFELEADAPKVIHPQFADRIPGDVGATWFFEDVRNHYLRELYAVDPARLRQDDPAQFIDMSRAVTAELLESVFALWRRQGSPTRGGLVWFFQDLMEGAGWGVVDSLGQPKAAWHALRRAFRPVQALLIDEGLNGLYVDLINDTAHDVPATLALTCLRDGASPAMRAERAIILQPRTTTRVAAVELWGAFFDTGYAYRFGPPSHDVTIAALKDSAGVTIADAFHFPLGRGHTRHEIQVSADLERDGDDWLLRVGADRFTQSLHVVDPNFRPEDNWFHLPPGETRTLRLIPRNQHRRGLAPGGHVAALNGLSATAYGVGG